jgi:hypothetical protein
MLRSVRKSRAVVVAVSLLSCVLLVAAALVATDSSRGDGPETGWRAAHRRATAQYWELVHGVEGEFDAVRLDALHACLMHGVSRSGCLAVFGPLPKK